MHKFVNKNEVVEHFENHPPINPGKLGVMLEDYSGKYKMYFDKNGKMDHERTAIESIPQWAVFSVPAVSEND